MLRAEEAYEENKEELRHARKRIYDLGADPDANLLPSVDKRLQSMIKNRRPPSGLLWQKIHPQAVRLAPDALLRVVARVESTNDFPMRMHPAMFRLRTDSLLVDK
jgi:hypothetical protein